MKIVLKIISAIMITTVVSMASFTPIIDSGIGSELDRIKEALTKKENDLTVKNTRVQTIQMDINKSKLQIGRYETLQTERVNVEAACRTEREQYKLENIWDDPESKAASEECFRELREEIPVYKKLAEYASSLLETMKKLAREAKRLGIQAPRLEAQIAQLKAHKTLEENR